MCSCNVSNHDFFCELTPSLKASFVLHKTSSGSKLSSTKKLVSIGIFHNGCFLSDALY